MSTIRCVHTSTKTLLQELSKQCYSFDGRSWTAKYPLPGYLKVGGVITYKGVFNAYSSPHHNVLGDAYIPGGDMCQDAQGNGCTPSPSVEKLDTSQGVWQTLSSSLGRRATAFQGAMLDNVLGALWRTNGTVNERFL